MSTLSEELKQFAKSYEITGNGEMKCVKMMKAAAEEIDALERQVDQNLAEQWAAIRDQAKTLRHVTRLEETIKEALESKQ